jgi:plastocyanin
MTLRAISILALLSAALACERATSPTTPDSSPAVSSPAINIASTSGGSTTRVLAQAARADVLVNMLDACDPATFAAQNITCIRSGGVTFNQFIAELTRLGFVGSWHFAPPTANVQVGQTFVAVNKGGEVHTFTEVEKFGGGIVPALNQLAHVPAVAPECRALERDDFVAPGASYREEVDHAGSLRFQCCIHPWMRLEARASTR